MMFIHKQQKIGILFILASIYALAWYLQNSMPLGCDLSWLMLASERMLAGGSYINSYFDPDPPMILYLYAPAVFLKKIFSFSVATAIHFYSFILASLSLVLCYTFLKKIFTQDDRIFGIIFFIALAATFLILPIYEFGQRDQILLMFTLPYFFLMAFRLQDGKVNSYYAGLIGVFAGLSIGIKPQFLIVPMIGEIYFIYCKKSLFAWVRPEVIIIFVVLISYCVLTFFQHPDYLFTVVPFAFHLYYKSVSISLGELILFAPFLFSCLAILFYAIQYPNNPYKNFATILVIALMGFLLSYLTQKIKYYYHMIPAISVATLLFVFLLSVLVLKIQPNKKDYLFSAVFSVILMSYLYPDNQALWTVIVFYPIVFFSFFIAVFTPLIYAYQRNLWKTIAIVACILFIGYFFSSSINHSPFFSHQFSLTILLLLVLFSLFTGSNFKEKMKYLVCASLGIIIFSLPLEFDLNHYQFWLARNNNLNSVTQFLQTKAAKQSVYFFSTEMPAFPTVDYTNTTYVSRYPFFWMMPALIKHPENLTKEKNDLIDAITDELNNQKPSYVIVDTSLHKRHLSYLDLRTYQIMDYPLDFIKYFSQSIHFQKAWKNYRYLGELEGNEMFKFAVYERV